MVTKYLNQPLGMGIGDGLQGTFAGVPFVPQPKLWIGAAIGAIGGIASSLIGGSAASDAAKEARRERERAEAKENAWYNRRYYENYLDTAAGQNLVRRAENIYKRGLKQAVGAAKVAGGTDASVAMAKEALNKGVGDTIANIAATDSDRKAQVDNIHMRNEQNFAQQRQTEQMQRAQNITNAAQAASNAMMSIGSAVDQASAKAPSLQGGDNNSKVVEKPAVQPVQSDGKIVNGMGEVVYDPDNLLMRQA